jgi:hypothetical protein
MEIPPAQEGGDWIAHGNMGRVFAVDAPDFLGGRANDPQ